MKSSLYRLTAGDRAIFDRARRENNPSIITNYYMRGEDSGTYWRPVSEAQIAQLSVPESIAAAQKWKDGYLSLLMVWDYLKQPDYFAPTAGGDWRAINEDEYNELREQLSRCYRVTWDDGDPVFHHPHGIQFIPWQLKAARSKHAVQVIVGGFGSAKTWYKLLTMSVRAITLPGYRAFALAPYSVQAQEVHTQILQAIEGTKFEQFLVAAPTKPFPKIVFGNDMVGKTTIECYPILDDPGKILTLTGDEALVDQAEKIDGTEGSDLDTLIRNVGSRFRGQYRGRPRVGQISLVANSADNPQLWDWFDEAETDPDYVWSYQPGTYENIHLTVSDLIRFERQVGKDEQSRKMYLKGERPIGSGEHFPAASIEKCRAEWMDEMMTDAINRGDEGFIRIEAPRVSVHTWETPPQDDEEYIVAADPGWGNPPYRNAAAIAVWAVRDFPRVPARLAAFSWVFGNNSPNPWLAKYTEYVIRYRAIAKNGFDATGTGSGYERMTDIGMLIPVPISLAGQKKFVYLNLAKRMMANGLFQMPTITHLFNQLAKYRLPDEKLRQDLVMMMLCSAAMLEPYYYIDTAEPDMEQYDAPMTDDRYWRPMEDRYIANYETERTER